MMEAQQSAAEERVPPPLPRERVSLQKSSVCSRSYFMVVMVFFHVYIINVIALLLYVHYNNSPGDDNSDATPFELPPRGPEPRSERALYLPRIEGIRVGHVQMVSLVPDRVHEMRTLSLKPLLFEVPNFLSEEECRLVVQLAQLKGLTESQVMVPEGQEELAEQLDLSPEEIFNLLDLNQDGRLQLQEVLTHSRVRDGIWLTPENLREIYIGLKADPDGDGLLSLAEFKQLSSNAFQRFLQQRGVQRSQLVRNSRHTWLYQGKGAHRVLRELRKRLGPPFDPQAVPSPLPTSPTCLLHATLLQKLFSCGQHSSPPAGHTRVCPHAGLCMCVHLASCVCLLQCRYITVLFYLNTVEGGGETTFPVADNRTYEEMSLIQNDVDLLDTRKNCDKGNLRVKPAKGTAVLWYNYLSDGKGWVGELDEYSLHGGCLVTRGTKWIANNWINVDPDYERQLRYQQLVSQADGTPNSSGSEPSTDQHGDAHQDL
ncbi:hypothetical protein GN956_G15949 [Arapaima gigas]